ncbi:MAG: cyclic nucleotide-binding domain-containing protein [Candidatus Sericytochromatia bacterium]|uniref:Cyclic nucleotide-binding domain-containing protein n=1 Tax=Candidatus Tanganyikabacteria bacterium TaxID=2961651 RepID=A0A938BLZ6_9BACT|nr:cyclic nucleotide-binding domain-containing protein [Candidatus Tanganyikabacteria bacterium]
MQQGLSEVSHLPLFAGLSAEEAQLFLALGHKQVLTSGHPLINAGEPADSFFLIVQGAIEVRVYQDGVATPVAQLQSGHLVGEMAFFQATPYRLADAVVVRDSLVCKFAFGRVHEFCALQPDLGKKIRRNLRYITTERARDNLARAERGQHALLTPIQARMAMARCPAFRDFSAEDLSALMAIAEAMRLGSLETVMHAGDPADCLYVVALGRLEVKIETMEGVFSVAQLGPGQCFGELPLVYDLQVRTATVMTTQPTTLLKLSYEALYAVLASMDGGYDRLRENLGSLALDRALELRNLEEGAAN